MVNELDHVVPIGEWSKLRVTRQITSSPETDAVSNDHVKQKYRKQHMNPNQMPLILPETPWQVPSSLPEGLWNLSTLALDTETCDPDLTTHGPSWFRGGGFTVGASLAWDGGKVYLPYGHAGGDNLEKARVLGWLQDTLAKFTGKLVLMNGFYDLGWLRMEGVKVPMTNIWDVMMVEALLDEHKQRYNLDSLAKTYHLPPKDERLLEEAAAAYSIEKKDIKKNLWRLPGRFVGPYAEQDAALTLEVYKRQLQEVQLQGLEKVVQLEHDLIPLLQEMRFRGVRVDVDKAAQLHKSFMDESEGHRLEIQRLTGYLPDIWAADSVAVAMDNMGIRYGRTAKDSSPSFTDDWLAGHDHVMPQLVSKARKAYKAGQGFCKGMVLDHADKNGRVHAEFNPLRSDDGGTVSGRFSSSNPNLQQVPARDPVMNTLIRGLFLPEEGERWAAVDYSQQEPRLAVHYAAERGCTRADEAVRRYNDDPNTDYHSFVAELVFGSGFTPKQRSLAKTINLGLAYGMGGAKLCRSLGYPTVRKTNSYSGKEYDAAGPEGQAILDKYNKEVPFVKELSKEYTKIAKEHGYIVTLSSRRCRFPFWEPVAGGRAQLREVAEKTYGAGNIRRAFTHTAFNRKIQGGSADMMKISMRNLWREGIVPLVTVHDENGVSVASRAGALKIAEIMSQCVKLKVPLKVDIDLGSSWGEAKPMKDEEAA